MGSPPLLVFALPDFDLVLVLHTPDPDIILMLPLANVVEPYCVNLWLVMLEFLTEPKESPVLVF